jgi:hypothetical protein
MEYTKKKKNTFLYIIKWFSYCYHLVNVINFPLSPSDHIKRLPLYLQLKCLIIKCKGESAFKMRIMRILRKKRIMLLGWEKIFLLSCNFQKGFIVYSFFYVTCGIFLILNNGCIIQYYSIFIYLLQMKQVLRSTILSSTIILIFFDNSRMGRF